MVGRLFQAGAGVFFVVFGVLAVSVMSGCTTRGGGDAQVEWKAPAWFAGQARQRDEVASILQDCVSRSGWDLTVNEYGGIEENLADFPDPQAPVAIVQSCYAEIPEKYNVTVDQTYLHDVLYPQQVDTYDCLVAHGVEPDPPPAVDIFVEAHLSTAEGGDPWIAWGGDWTTEYTQGGAHTEADLAELEIECPQPYVAP